MVRTALYLRTANHTPNNEVIHQQRNIIAQYAQANNLTVSLEYCDVGPAAAPQSPLNPGLQQLLRDAAEGKYDILLVTRYDRLHRNTSILLACVRQLHDCGVLVHSITDHAAIDSLFLLPPAIPRPQKF